MNIAAHQVLRIFVSHSSEDSDFAVKLVHDLRHILGDDAVWYYSSGDSQDDIRWNRVLEELMARPMFIIVLSPAAMSSKQVRREFDIALNEGKFIVPILHRECGLWTDLRVIQYISFLPSRPYKSAFNDLLMALGLKMDAVEDKEKNFAGSDTGLVSEPPVGIPSTVTARPIPLVKRQQLQPRISRRTVALGLAGVAGLALGGGGITWWIRSQTPQIQKPQIGTTLVTYRGHFDQVFDVAWSPDGKTLVSASADKTVQVWNAATGQHILTYHGHTDIVRQAVWSPDGKYIASASDDKTVQVWNAFTGDLHFIYLGHSGKLDTLAWSPDGRYIASASNDDVLQVWDASTQALVYAHPHDADTLIVFSLAWSRDSKRIVVAGYRTLQAWDATTGNNLITYSDNPKGSLDVAWSPDGRRIAASGYLGTSAQIWNADPGSNTYSYHGHTDTVFAVAWSPDSAHIASGSWDKTVQIWNPNTGERIYTYHGHSIGVYAAPWSPDGKRIASASADKTVQVWQAV